MQKLISPPWAGDYALRALEACCGALRSLEVVRAQAGEAGDAEREAHIARVIERVRETISELQLISQDASNGPAAGFILPRQPPSANGKH